MSSKLENLKLSEWTLPELRALIPFAQQEIERQQESEKKAFIAEMKVRAAERGLDYDEVVKSSQSSDESKKRGRKPQNDNDSEPTKKAVEPKYRNPENPSETWAGRGRQPAWVKQRLEAGATIESLLIENA